MKLMDGYGDPLLWLIYGMTVSAFVAAPLAYRDGETGLAVIFGVLGFVFLGCVVALVRKDS